MKLNSEPFELMKTGQKTLEVRLYDEKRQQLETGDTIVFTRIPKDTKETVQNITTEIQELYHFSSFKEMYTFFPPQRFGHPKKITLEKQLEGVREIYSKEQEEKYGVLAIGLKIK